jgi:hypothetical protein
MLSNPVPHETELLTSEKGGKSTVTEGLLEERRWAWHCSLTLGRVQNFSILGPYNPQLVRTDAVAQCSAACRPASGTLVDNRQTVSV